jgi:hypothetical protein
MTCHLGVRDRDSGQPTQPSRPARDDVRQVLANLRAALTAHADHPGVGEILAAIDASEHAAVPEEAPADFTFAEFMRAVEIACVESWQSCVRYPESGRRRNPTIFLPHAVFPTLTWVTNPITGDQVPIKRLSMFDWGSRDHC